MGVILNVWDATPRGPHHLQRVRVQRASHVEPEEYLHVFDFGGEGGRAPLRATAGLSLQVVEALEVVLQRGFEMDRVAAESQVDAIKAAKCLHVAAPNHNSHKNICNTKVAGLFFLTLTKRNITCSRRVNALTVASLKSNCGSVDGEILAAAGGTVGAVKHRPGRSKTKTQTQDSSMTCISQT